jgi:tetratricopeptide (TPR) repeat protein
VIEFAADAAGQRAQLRAERAARGEPALDEAQEWCVVAYRLDTAGYPAGAADAWRAALALDPAIPRAHLGLGRALLELGDGEGAAAEARAALEAHANADAKKEERLLDDPDEDPWYVLGLAEHRRGRLAEAVAAYAKSAEAYPWFPEPLFETARAELARGDRARAADAAHRALKRAKFRPELGREIEAVLRDAQGTGPRAQG